MSVDGNKLEQQDIAARARALEPARSFIVQAPAGSGKTELLTQRFLVLLAHVESPEEIVALTFTRKAAGEMMDRVLKALQSADGPEPEEPHRRQTWMLAKAAMMMMSPTCTWRAAPPLSEITPLPASARMA